MTADFGTFLVPAPGGRSICVLDARLEAFLPQSAKEEERNDTKGSMLVNNTFKWSGTAQLRAIYRLQSNS